MEPLDGSPWLVPVRNQDPVLKIVEVDDQTVAEFRGDVRHAARPSPPGRPKEVEQGDAVRAEVACDQRGEGVPTGVGFLDLTVPGNRQIVQDHVEMSGRPKPFHGVGVMPFEGLKPESARISEKFQAGGVEVDGMNAGLAAKGTERGHDASATETEQRNVTDGRADEAGCGEHIEDAVGGAGVEQDFAEDSSVLGQSPTLSGASNRGGWVKRDHASKGWMTLPWTSVSRKRRPWKK